MAKSSARAAFNAAVEDADALLVQVEAAEANLEEGAEPPHEPRASYNAALAHIETLREAADAETYEDEAEVVSEVPAE